MTQGKKFKIEVPEISCQCSFKKYTHGNVVGYGRVSVGTILVRYLLGSVLDPKRLFPDQDLTFQLIPDPGQNLFFKEHKIKFFYTSFRSV